VGGVGGGRPPLGHQGPLLFREHKGKPDRSRDSQRCSVAATREAGQAKPDRALDQSMTRGQGIALGLGNSMGHHVPELVTKDLERFFSAILGRVMAGMAPKPAPGWQHKAAHSGYRKSR